jgi:hypothetical protein
VKRLEEEEEDFDLLLVIPQQISTESQTALIHHSSVTTKHDKQSKITAGEVGAETRREKIIDAVLA